MRASHVRGSETRNPECSSSAELRRLIFRALLILNGSAAVGMFALVLMALQRNAALLRAGAAGFFLACLGIAFAFVGGMLTRRTSEAPERSPVGAWQWNCARRMLLYPSLLAFVLAAAVVAFGTWLSPGGFLQDQGIAVPGASEARAAGAESRTQIEVQASASPLWYLIFDVVLGCLIAIGTISVAILAIFGGSIVRYLFGPELRLETVVHENEPDWVDGQREWYFHLRVKNDLPEWPWWLRWLRWLPRVLHVRLAPRPASNCRVRLRCFKRLDKDAKWRDESFVVPLQYCWPFSAANDNPTIAADPAKGFRQIVNDEVIDFGSLSEKEEKEVGLRPWLYDASDYWKTASVKRGETAKYYLEIVSDQFTSRNPHVFEVHYDKRGWTEDKNEIRKRLRARS